MEQSVNTATRIPWHSKSAPTVVLWPHLHNISRASLCIDHKGAFPTGNFFVFPLGASVIPRIFCPFRQVCNSCPELDSFRNVFTTSLQYMTSIDYWLKPSGAPVWCKSPKSSLALGIVYLSTTPQVFWHRSSMKDNACMLAHCTHSQQNLQSNVHELLHRKGIFADYKNGCIAS